MSYFPFLLQIDVTPRCNLSCIHCRTAFSAKGELEISQWINILEPIFAEAPRKIQWVAIGGGEPTLYNDLLNLVLYLRNKTKTILLMTNGVKIAEEPGILDSLMKVGVNRVQLSLESPDLLVHDKIRGQGTYNQVLNAASACRRRGLDLAFRMTLNHLNKDVYRDLIVMASGYEAAEVNIRKVIPVGKARNIFPVDCITQEEYKEILSNFPSLEENFGVFINSEEPLRYIVHPKFVHLASPNGRMKRGCPAGISYAYVDPEGRMRPCSNIPEILGDLKEYSFWDLWNNHYWMKRLRERDFEKCIDCKFKNICGGCRAMAKIETDDWWGIDPNCWL